ncbi:riboflavin synthase [Candidatus Bandiella euplotis]|uniref:Riboflavin synthase n=1 Tax=Candidatus Bandiella euplotis TaxID=1664265 RepID=A0ABZ0ULG3_9RICK|nr:riboflavin synthase [Candidatus Bandiella woodruffii]WPX96559.1 Riboflavin synthase [Candidatus Bandiella woodruffii]
MFSGIIVDIGTISHINKESRDWKILIRTSLNLKEVSIGDSIACDGICLTVIEVLEHELVLQASLETQKVTNLAQWNNGYKVNLEKALKVGDLLNGHFVQGHVDCAVKLLGTETIGGSHALQFELPHKIKKYIVNKGAITINGVSLTVNEVTDHQFFVNIIPHTWGCTNLSNLIIGAKVNLEVDLLARYLEKLRGDVKNQL